MISAADRARQAQAVAEIFDLMRKRGLVLDDLIEIGGQDLCSSTKQVAKAHSVEKTWALMARLSVKFADLEQAPDNPRLNRHEGDVARRCFHKPLKTNSFRLTHPTKSSL